MSFKKKTLIFAYFSGLLLLGLDFGIKALANHNLPLHEKVSTFLPFLDLFLTHNTGYHFIFGKIGNHVLWASSGLVLVSGLVFSISRSIIKEEYTGFYTKIYAVVLAMTIGAMANVIEILIYGRATDFFILHPFPWPSNICDQYINGIVYVVIPIIIIKSLIDRKNAKKQNSEDLKTN